MVAHGPLIRCCCYCRLYTHVSVWAVSPTVCPCLSHRLLRSYFSKVAGGGLPDVVLDMSLRPLLQVWAACFGRS